MNIAAVNAINIKWNFDPESISGYGVDRQTAYFRLKKLMSEFVWDLVCLEDNPYSFSEVQTLIEGITVGGHTLFDQKQILNQFASLKQLLDIIKNDSFVFEKETILSAHKLIAEEEALKWGCLRDGQVCISGTEHKPPQSDELPSLMSKGIREIAKIDNPFERALVYFCFGSINQFFYDGNKRTSRWVMNAILMSNGYNYLSVPCSKKSEFNTSMVRFYDSRDASEVIEFMRSCYVED